jgi:hypothetical protein
MAGYVTCGTNHHHLHYCWQLMAEYVTCGTNHHIQYYWQLMAEYVTCGINHHIQYYWQLMAGYVACGTNHHLQYYWQLMAEYVTCGTNHHIRIAGSCGRICYLWYKPPYLPEYIVELSAFYCLMIEKALQDCFYPRRACIKITVFVLLLQLTSH